ncbi:hypothetical protein G9A89_008755 [Geosiphon pyriformis]|nr:hypothetical protein G9A89_008755 [Geosiphon pyriformis]
MCDTSNDRMTIVSNSRVNNTSAFLLCVTSNNSQPNLNNRSGVLKPNGITENKLLKPITRRLSRDALKLQLAVLIQLRHMFSLLDYAHVGSAIHVESNIKYPKKLSSSPSIAVFEDDTGVEVAEVLTVVMAAFRKLVWTKLKSVQAKFFYFPISIRVHHRFSFQPPLSMGKAKRTRKFAQVKRLLNPNDARLKAVQEKQQKKKEEKEKNTVRQVPQVASSLFFRHNKALGPPYQILIDTNFINFSLQNKLELVEAMMDCLYAKCIPCITDCVMAELEKLGPKYRIALRVARDPRFERLPCMHKGSYADDCLVQRATQHKCYIVATCDRDLKRRIRKIPGIPIMYISKRKYTIERLPEAYGAPA